ncbi:MAG TPA: aldo/keto reductase [Planctomycetota bacterium]|nr:aldo/keto reductase [Planctomycetota bacterium]
MERREFLRYAAAAGAVVLGGGAADASAGEPKAERRNEQPSMRYARLGRTNLMVSRIVHGSLHTNRERIPLLARLYEGGVNLFDTSHVYGGGRSEEAIGEFLSGDGRRKNAFLCTKMDIRANLRAKRDVYKAAMERAEGSLRRLRTDHVDIMMLHGCTTLVDYVKDEEWLRATEDLKKQGKIRFIGLSEHAKPAETLQLAAESGRYDVAMVAFSLVKGAWGSLGRSDIKTMEPALEAARKADMGILVMKAALQADKIVAAVPNPKLKKAGLSPFQLCYRYVLDIPGVAAVTCGMVNMAQAEENLKVPALDLAASDIERLHRAAARTRVCGFCGTCLDACPAGIAVQDILRFEGYHHHGHRAAARAEYAALPPERRATACQGCGACERACPKGIPIRRRLQEAHRALA